MSESFDRIVALDFVEHISGKECQQFVDEAHRVLKPGGLLCLYTPNRNYWYEAIYTAIAGSSPTRGHIDVKASKWLQALLEEKGFTVSWKALKPSHYRLLRTIEGLMIGIPWLCQIAGRRISMRAVKGS